MDNRRNLLAIPFKEIETEEDRYSFIFALLNLDEFTRREILHNQADINSDCMTDLLLFLQNSPLYESEDGKDLYIKFLSIFSRDVILSYDTLCNTSRQHFIMDLLIRDAYSRRELLAKQHHEDENNLSLLLHNLTYDWCDTFDSHSNYPGLINDILNIQENTASKQLDSKKHHSEKSGQVATSIPMPEIIKQKFDIIFSDPIWLSTISNSWISPQGSTYDFDSIETCINAQHIDPINRSDLKLTDLVKNNLFPLIKDLIIKTVENENQFLDQLDLISLQQLLCCPLSGKLFVNPVVAEDGETYERENLEAYLQLHDNKTPLNIQQSKPLIPNRFIISLYDEMKIKDIIQNNLNPEKPVQETETDQQTLNNSSSNHSDSSIFTTSDITDKNSRNDNLSADNETDKTNISTQENAPIHTSQFYTHQPAIHILFFSYQRIAVLPQQTYRDEKSLTNR